MEARTEEEENRGGVVAGRSGSKSQSPGDGGYPCMDQSLPRLTGRSQRPPNQWLIKPLPVRGIHEHLRWQVEARDPLPRSLDAQHRRPYEPRCPACALRPGDGRGCNLDAREGQEEEIGIFPNPSLPASSVAGNGAKGEHESLWKARGEQHLELPRRPASLITTGYG